MPSHPELDDLHGKLESRYKIYKLRDALAELATTTTEIYIDTPPALNFYTRSALIAAQRCLIPFDCDDFSRRALYTLLDNVEEIQADHNRDLEVDGIVVNQFQARAILPQRLVQELMDEGLPVLQPYLSASVKIKESHELARPMIHLDAAPQADAGIRRAARRTGQAGAVRAGAPGVVAPAAGRRPPPPPSRGFIRVFH